MSDEKEEVPPLLAPELSPEIRAAILGAKPATENVEVTENAEVAFEKPVEKSEPETSVPVASPPSPKEPLSPHVEPLMLALENEGNGIDLLATGLGKSIERLGLSPYASIVALSHGMAAVLVKSGNSLDLAFTALETFYEHAYRSILRLGDRVMFTQNGAEGIVQSVHSDGIVVKWNTNGGKVLVTKVPMASLEKVE
jgi:hypothetical protein